MGFPAFFERVEALTVRDRLAELLGAVAEGDTLTYHYSDAVRLAGHSCPTVASAYLMASAAMRALYPGETPLRGGVSVHMSTPESQGVTGVIAQVFTLLTGAAADNGFHGLAGGHRRQGLLTYGSALEDRGVVVTRLDTQASVRVSADLDGVPPHPAMRELIGQVLGGGASQEQRQAFGDAWQDRVKRLLLEHADDPAVIRVAS